MISRVEVGFLNGSLWKGGEMRAEGSMCVRWGPYLKIHSNRFFLITLLIRFLNTLWPKEILNRVTWNKNTSMWVSHATHLYLKMYHESLKYCRSHKSFTTNDLRLGVNACVCHQMTQELPYEPFYPKMRNLIQQYHILKRNF